MLKTFSIRSNEVLNSECLRSVVLSSVRGLPGGPWRLSVGLFKKVAVVVGGCKEGGRDCRIYTQEANNLYSSTETLGSGQARNGKFHERFHANEP